ncbi:HI1506-related protein [Mesorhizobium sp. J428]|uniref:HI1506-related protein n=1 Tax=Mesorhizobium sp. J428 TaxID=2898440 RepID=UPI002151E5D9|nr:HI1506-related protein [Mesorhizobium sp. J428]MCR5855991.1 HI1506-related protein [Mesorhizobium sp. J428]
MAKASKPTRAVEVPEGAAVAKAAVGKRPVDAGGAQPDPTLAEEHVDSSATNTPRGSSGTAREASSAGSGVAIDGSATGTQSGSPNPSEDASQAVTEGGGTGASEAGPASAAFLVPEDVVNEAHAKYPLLFGAWEAWRAASPDAPPTSIQIKSKVEGFRRAGIAHSRTPTEHPIGTFNPDQVEALLAEPHLTVRFV